MYTIVDPMSNDTQPPATIETTLYDLIEAISAEVNPNEEDLVVATIVHLLASGKVKFLGNLG